MGLYLVKPLLVQILVHHYHALVRAKRALNASNETVELAKIASVLGGERLRGPKDHIVHIACVETEDEARTVRRNCLKQLREEEYFLNKFVPDMKSIVGDCGDVEVKHLYARFGSENDGVPDAEAHSRAAADDYDEDDDENIVERKPTYTCNMMTAK